VILEIVIIESFECIVRDFVVHVLVEDEHDAFVAF
jgi:hypothetical protein